MEQVVSLIIPFIALSILSVMIDRFTMVLEDFMHMIPGLPDKLEASFAYVLVLIISFAICYYGDFDLFIYLDIEFIHRWIGYLMTSLIISGGSYYVRHNFNTINEIPSALSGILGAACSIFKK